MKVINPNWTEAQENQYQDFVKDIRAKQSQGVEKIEIGIADIDLVLARPGTNIVNGIRTEDFRVFPNNQLVLIEKQDA